MTKVAEQPLPMDCPDCGGPLDFQYEKPPALGDGVTSSMWRYRNILPVRPGTTVLSMGEGLTPLQKAQSFEPWEVYIKNEALNPTGSHKDRALSIGITKALEFGKDPVMLYSDGSTALSSAAYAARAGVRNITLVPARTPKYRLLPLVLYNSLVLEYQGRAAEGLSWVHRACKELDIYETSNYRQANPYESEGAKTIGLEILEQLHRVPDWVVVPVGGGCTLAGIWRAFQELHAWGFATKLPHMVAILPDHYTILENALERNVATEAEFEALAAVDLPATIQAKIAMSCPPDGLEAMAAIRESEGLILYSSDHDVLEAQKRLGSREGIYAEPSAAASFVGVEKLLKMNHAGSNQSIVAIVTGSGFRETGTISNMVGVAPVPITPEAGIGVLQEILARWGQKNMSKEE